NLQLMVTTGLGWLAEGYLLAGRAPEAVAALQESLSHRAEMRFGAFHRRHEVLLAEARLTMGEVDEAARLARDAVEQCRRHGQRGFEAHGLRVLADVAAHP